MRKFDRRDKIEMREEVPGKHSIEKPEEANGGLKNAKTTQRTRVCPVMRKLSVNAQQALQ